MKNYEITDFNSIVSHLIESHEMTRHEAFRVSIELEKLNEISKHFDDFKAANVLRKDTSSALSRISIKL